jgi:hypothetical protein
MGCWFCFRDRPRILASRRRAPCFRVASLALLGQRVQLVGWFPAHAVSFRILRNSLGVSLFLTRVELNDTLVYENSASK